jgi:mannosyltransferase
VRTEASANGRVEAVGRGQEDRSHRIFLWIAAAVGVAVLWLWPLPSSLWVDEFGTWWVIQGGIREVIDRAWTYQGQSPLFYVLVWGLRHLTGSGEWALRSPSVVAAAASAYLLYRLIVRLVDTECARIAAIVFITWPIAVFAAADFRPYALATFAVVASTLVLVRWLDRGGLGTAAGYVALVAVTFYAHYLFGLVVIAQGIYAFARVRERSTRVRLRDLAFVGVAMFAVLAPLAVGAAALWERRAAVGFTDTVTLEWVIVLAVPIAIVGALAVGGLLVLLGRGKLVRPPIGRVDLLLLVAWTVAPMAALILIALVSPIGLQARYTLVWVPAAAGLVALAIRALEPASLRRIVVAVLVIVAILTLANAQHLGDWRGAMWAARDRADDRSVVLVESGFVESLRLEWFDDAERRSYLGAQASYYRVPGRVVVLPVDPASSPAFVREQVERAAKGADRVLLVGFSAAGPQLVLEILGEDRWVMRQLPADPPTAFEFVRVGADDD